MRGAACIVVIVAGLVTASAAAMGQALSGPLDSPGDTSIVQPAKPSRADVAAKPAKRVAARRAKASASMKRTAVPASARLPAEAMPAPTAVGTSAATSPNDPLSFGMKWNGSNDSAGQTRIENLNGSAAGTGAEVGMKLHF